MNSSIDMLSENKWWRDLGSYEYTDYLLEKERRRKHWMEKRMNNAIPI